MTRSVGQATTRTGRVDRAWFGQADRTSHGNSPLLQDRRARARGQKMEAIACFHSRLVGIYGCVSAPGVFAMGSYGYDEKWGFHTGCGDLLRLTREELREKGLGMVLHRGDDVVLLRHQRSAESEGGRTPGVLTRQPTAIRSPSRRPRRCARGWMRAFAVRRAW